MGAYTPEFTVWVWVDVGVRRDANRCFSATLGDNPIKKTRENAVYVTGLASDVTEEKLSELFGSIGVIKVGLGFQGGWGESFPSKDQLTSTSHLSESK